MTKVIQYFWKAVPTKEHLNRLNIGRGVDLPIGNKGEVVNRPLFTEEQMTIKGIFVPKNLDNIFGTGKFLCMKYLENDNREKRFVYDGYEIKTIEVDDKYKYTNQLGINHNDVCKKELTK